MIQQSQACTLVFMFVITADQRASRRGPDLVPHALTVLQAVTMAVPFERTVGDEIQGVANDPEEVLRAISLLSVSHRWSIGLGVGAVEQPLPRSSREGRGPAFIHARSAVENAKGLYPSFQLKGGGSTAEIDANSALALLAGVWLKRTEPGWEAVRTLQEHHHKQSNAARALGISEQAFSQRLKTALWQLESDSRPTILRLLRKAESEALRHMERTRH